MAVDPTAGEEGHGADATVADRNERLVREYFRAVWNDGDLAPFDGGVVSDDYVMHHQSDVEYSVAELRAACTDWHRAFPDCSNQIEDLVATNDRVVVRYWFSGTHEGELLGIPATGKRVQTAGIVVFRFDDGRIAEEWAMDDVAGLLEQLDATG
jgi:steroid delta-isomerase-like uncharacterized protein